MRPIITAVLCISVTALTAIPSAYSQEESQYKKFKMDDETASVAIMYKLKPDGMDVAVSAVATGKGAEFRKWEVTDIRLRIAGEAIKPDSYGRFYVTKESIFRYPAAVLFAVIGATINTEGSGLSQGITAVGAAIGLGLLATQAKGNIAGQNASFKLSGELAGKIGDGDAVEITAEDKDLHLKDVIRTGLTPPSAVARTPPSDYSGMTRDDIFTKMNTMKSEIEELETRQSSYKYGENPEYDDIQKKIESLETERGLAYRTWYDKGNNS
ncbi:MAG: hypothetical protein NTZ95_07600 [Candidatus Omnitrophica bacterium]|nr:hypothetical protein [Candidatus Omnitrophota bacterium]